MENRYQLTSEEINKILCHSPRSLSASPAEQGLGAQQIRKYFYDFIYTFLRIIYINVSEPKIHHVTYTGTEILFELFELTFLNDIQVVLVIV